MTESTSRRPNPTTSIIGIGAAALLGVVMAWAGSDSGLEIGGSRIFALAAALAFVINIVVYVPSLIARTEHWFDLTGSLTYLSVVLFAVVAAGRWDGRSVVLTALVCVWAARLGSFLFARIKRDGKDGRFDKIKADWLRFLMTWMLQGLWVLFTLGAAIAAITSGEQKNVGWVAVIGVIVWIAGFSLEVVADLQKSRFKLDPANKGAFITTGVWAWSRHPNYFGEITLWVGVAIIALPVLNGWQYLTLISPVFVFVLLTRISGVPMLARRGLKRWGDDPAYQAYLASTPTLVPRPPR